MTRPDDATSAQIRAADPAQSTWVSANAGSGKTRVLTDRVARLLLRNVRPERILCLTYTKAAATHMQNQLFNRLGKWAMLEDHDLRTALLDLGEAPESLTRTDLSRARTLFASALETPGGLKIQTIHSFCASLLRLFPLEAGVSPNFQEMDDRTARRLRTETLERLALADEGHVFATMAEVLGGEDLDKFCREIIAKAAYFSSNPGEAEILAALDLDADASVEGYLNHVFRDWNDELLRRLVAALRSVPSSESQANNLEAFIGQPLTLQMATVLESHFVYGPKAKKAGQSKSGSYPTKKAKEFDPGLATILDPVLDGFADAAPLRKGLAIAERTAALYAFARPFLATYNRLKSAQGWLDFDDLIEMAKGLLTESSMAAWVLFKLDGGIDHILVDEAQDTSPAQWAVIEKLAEEFWTGSEIAEAERTLFVVGDEKQSIYSFQGADPSAFDRMKRLFRDRLETTERTLNIRELLYSFRSSPAILSLVDIALKPGNLAETSLTLTHRSFHSELPGRVDLWPFIDANPKPEFPDWTGLEPINVTTHHNTELAEQIATQIRNLLESGEQIADKNGPRPVVPGDILILVQRRRMLFSEIIRCLKAEGLPVAGSDRLKISRELAVKDLVSTLSFLATPEDDLSLAEALKSPLFGLDEQALFSLAHDRKGSLWQNLENNRAPFEDAHQILTDLRKNTDFLRPYDLLERLLVRHQGRAKLIARLGPEVEDGIDAFLAQAMSYEQVEPPTLSGFLDWIAQDDSELKREMDSQSSEIRVMTVHGAKGLEAPIVILPDTSHRNAARPSHLYPISDDLIVWAKNQETDPAVVAAAKQAEKNLQEQERSRLLYVAMTRAETWLIVCGADKIDKDGTCWYSQVEDAMNRVDARTMEVGGQTILRYQPLPWPDQGPMAENAPSPKTPPRAKWLEGKAPTPSRPPKPRTPSDLGGEKALPGGVLQAEGEKSKTRGRLLHALLENLPETPENAWDAVAEFLASGLEEKLETTDVQAIYRRAKLLLKSPDLRDLFGTHALREVPYAVTLKGEVWRGEIDVLVVGKTRVEIIDFKSNAAIPNAPTDVPEGILRQMGAYHQAVSLIYPEREIEVAILWTETAELMRLPHDIVTNAWQRATTS